MSGRSQRKIGSHQSVGCHPGKHRVHCSLGGDVTVRRSPRKHRVREHRRSKPRGGGTDVDPYDRGRGGSRISSSAGGRAQTRTMFLKAKDAKLARAAKRKSERRAFVEAARRKGQLTLDYMLGVESDVFADRWGKEKLEDEELL